MIKKTFLLFIFSYINVNAQHFSFLQNETLTVIENSDTLNNPWAGGLNFCQFSEIDLNLDGEKDLMIFDKVKDMKYYKII